MAKKTISRILILVFLASVILPLSYAVYFRNKILPNVFIAQINMSGKNRNEAKTILSQLYANLPDRQFKFVYQGRSWVANAEQLGISIDLDQTVNKAFAVARSPSITQNITTLATIFYHSIKLPLSMSTNEQLFIDTVNPIAQEVNLAMVPPVVNLQANEIFLIPGIAGKKLDQSLLQKEIFQAIEVNFSSDINLPVSDINLPYSKEDENRTLDRATSLKDKKLIFTIADNSYELSKQELISLLSFANGFDLDKVASLSAKLSQAFDKPPQNAAFQFDNGRVTVFKPSKDGLTLEQKQTITLVNNSLTDLEASTTAKLNTVLPVIRQEAEIKISEINNLGIKEMIGKGLSYFKGSIPSRVHNLTLASSKLNGTLIAPEETFSFNKIVGDISGNTGYQQAYVIQNGRTVLGDGGGVCQVSTTLFRAALNSGLPIVERQAHAYRVAYYEQGFGAGLDATVFDPSVDLKILNNTPAHILIQTEVDAKNNSLIFELYGTSDGRKASVSTPRVWDQVPPPPPKYEDDPTLQAGIEKQVDWAAWGAKAAFDYKVVRNGEILINKTFFSNFRPWQAVYLKGTRQ